ncbi:hypothetical protein K1719_022841 [Acacia pycnantha]|nr:hypothetical protein K1719_022841 [Acacia pycnantha]
MKQSRCNIVYLGRNPKDLFVSRIPLRIFEELKNDPVRTLNEPAEFIAYDFSREEENGDVVGNILKLYSFENLSCLEVNRTESSRFGLKNKLCFR